MLTLLLVEDHALVREGLSQILQQLDPDLRLLEAADGNQAVALLESEPDIDLVMLDPEARVLVLVEVRSRSRSDYGQAAATISLAKQRRCSLAARHLLLTRRELRPLRARFDVVAIDPPAEPGGTSVVTWIRNAFMLC